MSASIAGRRRGGRRPGRARNAAHRAQIAAGHAGRAVWTPPLKHTTTPPSKSRKHGGKPGRR